jgi:hypothetical protein
MRASRPDPSKVVALFDLTLEDCEVDCVFGPQCTDLLAGLLALAFPGAMQLGDAGNRAELWPEVVAEARRLRAKGKAGRLSYREISARLKDAGYCNDAISRSIRRAFAP